MIERDIEEFITSIVDPAVTVVWGNVDKSTDWESEIVAVNFFKVPSLASIETPTYLDSFQVSARSKYIDAAQEVCNQILEAFHGYNGVIGSYRVWCVEASSGGQIQEAVNIVQAPANISLKYTGL